MSDSGDRASLALSEPSFAGCFVASRGSTACRKSELGHVWTAPWQELSDVAAALVGCGHVSGLLMRHGWPLALMLCADQVPIHRVHSMMR